MRNAPTAPPKRPALFRHECVRGHARVNVTVGQYPPFIYRRAEVHHSELWRICSVQIACSAQLVSVAWQGDSGVRYIYILYDSGVRRDPRTGHAMVPGPSGPAGAARRPRFTPASPSNATAVRQSVCSPLTRRSWALRSSSKGRRARSTPIPRGRGKRQWSC